MKKISSKAWSRKKKIQERKNKRNDFFENFSLLLFLFGMKVKYENDVLVLFEQARTIGLVLYGPGFFSGPIELFSIK